MSDMVSAIEQAGIGRYSVGAFGNGGFAESWIRGAAEDRSVRRRLMAVLRMASSALGMSRKRLGVGMLGASVGAAALTLGFAGSASADIFVNAGVDGTCTQLRDGGSGSVGNAGTATLSFCNQPMVSQTSAVVQQGTKDLSVGGILYGNAGKFGLTDYTGGTYSMRMGSESTLNAAAGENAIAIGSAQTTTGAGAATVASGARAIAIGQSVIASGVSSTAIGSLARAQGDSSFAGGNNAGALGTQSVAVGNVAGAVGNTSVAIGNFSAAAGAGSIAMGDNAEADADRGTAVGANAIATNTADVALGSGSVTAAAVGTSGATIGGNPYTFAGTAPVSTLSIGAVGTERTLTNLAAGRLSSTSTDGVNGSQLFATNTAIDNLSTAVAAGETHYFSVNVTTGTQTQNYDNDRATGQNAVAIGPSSAFGANSVALGASAFAPNEAGVAIGATATSFGISSVAIGEQANSVGASSVAMGDRAFAQNAGDIAIGKTALAIGANGGSAVSIGANNEAFGAGAVAIGDPSFASGTGAFVGGADNIANSDGTASASAANAANGAVAIGNANKAVGQGSVALGNTSQALAAGSLAFGDAARANNARDVALGSGSVTAAAVGTANTIIDGATYGFAGIAPASTVSIGAAGAERTLTNLAAGRLSATSTDGVNGSQLFATNTAIETLAAGQTHYFSVDDSGSPQANYNNDGAAGANAIAIGPKAVSNGDIAVAIGFDAIASEDSAVAMGGGARANALSSTALGQLSTANGDFSTAIGFTSVADAENSVAIGFSSFAANKDDVALGSNSFTDAANAVTGDTVNGVNYVYAGTAPTSVVSVGGIGLERQVTNVAAGRVLATSTDAINGSQLFATNSAIEDLAAGQTHYFSTNDGTVPQANYDNDGATGVQAIAAGVGTSASGISSTAMGVLAAASGNNSIAIGDSAAASGQASISIGARSSATAIAATAVGPNTTATGLSASAFGDNSDATGDYSSAIGPGSRATARTGVALGNDSVANVAAGVTGYDPTTGGASTNTGNVWVSNKGAVSIGGNGWTRQINNLAAGSLDTDAVNVAQLKSLQTVVAAGQTHYFSTNDTGLEQGNFDNDGATGAQAIAAGIGTTAAGTSSTAMGVLASASGNNTVAIGDSSAASGLASIAIGGQSAASAKGATAVGPGSTATALSASAFGDNSHATGEHSAALGGGSRALATGSVAIGDASVANTAAGATGYDPTTGGASTNTGSAWVSTRGAVSIGANGQTRQINNLAAGTVDTDAVNVAQLKSLQTVVAAGQTHYYSVNDGGTQQANYDNDGATGMNAVASGVAAEATGDGSFAGGANAQATGTQSVALGQDTRATGVTSTAIGAGASATDRGTAMGTRSAAVGIESAAFGADSVALRDQSAAFGSLSKAQGASSVAIGFGAFATRDGDVALGALSRTAAANATASGTIAGVTYNYAGATPTSVVSVGDVGAERQVTNVAAGQVTATSTDAINGSQLFATNSAISSLVAGQTHYYSVNDGGVQGGNYNNDGATGTNAHAAGVGALASGDLAGATGYNANASGRASTSIGANSEASGESAVALGDTSLASGLQSTAIGPASNATGLGAVSVGASSGASGRSAAAFGDSSKATAEYSTALGAGSEATVENGVALGSFSVANTAAGEVGYDPVTGLPSTNTGSAWVSNAGAVSVGGNGVTRQITNLAAGSLDTDAVNVAQLKMLESTVAAGETHYYSVNDGGVQGGNYDNDGATGTNAVASGVDARASGNASYAGGNGAAATGDNAIALGNQSAASGLDSTAIGNGAQALNDGDVALGSGSVTAAANPTASGIIDGTTYAYAGANPTSVVSVGSVGSERQISNVAAGRVSATSTDAVNGSQLFATNTAIENLSSMVVSNTTHYYSVNDGGTTQGNFNNNGATGLNSIASGAGASATGGGAIAMGNNASATAAGSTAIGQGATASTANSVALGADSVTQAAVGTSSTTIRGTKYDFAGANPVGTVSVGDQGKERTITNVAAGRLSETSTDAVNGSQLYATNQSIENIQGGVSTLDKFTVKYDNNGTDKYNSITLAGGDPNAPVVIHNVAAGKADTDAVNVSQLHQGMSTTLNQANSYTDQIAGDTLNQANSYTDNKFNQLNGEFNSIKSEARRGAAIGLAAASLRYDDRPGKLSAAIGAGFWKGEGAFAFGAGYTSEDGRLRTNLSGTTAGGDWGVGAGLSYTFN